MHFFEPFTSLITGIERQGFVDSAADVANRGELPGQDRSPRLL